MLLAVIAPVARAAVTPTVAGLETGDFSEFSQTNVVTGTLAVTSEQAYEGTRSAKATYSGGVSNGFSRGIFFVSWPDGADLWYGSAFYLPAGFRAAQTGYIDLMRWDNFASFGDDADYGGIAIYGSDKKARLLRGKYSGGAEGLVGPFDLPEGRWFWLEVHQRLSAQDPLSEVYLDGTLIGSSAAPNDYGRPAERIRYGIVAVDPSSQLGTLTLYFDRASVSTAALGPFRRDPPALPVPPSATFSKPKNRSTLRRLRRLRGKVDHGVARVEVALQILPSGRHFKRHSHDTEAVKKCRVLTSANTRGRKRFSSARSCSLATLEWLGARISDDAWSLALKKGLPRRKFRAYVRACDATGNCGNVFDARGEKNKISFKVAKRAKSR